MAVQDANLTIALRRTPRRQCRLSTSAPETHASPSTAQAQHHNLRQRRRRQTCLSSEAQTKTRQTKAQTQTQPRKRKRHSEPSPIVIHEDQAEDGGNNDGVVRPSQHGRSSHGRTATATATKQSGPGVPAAKRRRYSAIPRLEGGRRGEKSQPASQLESSSERQQQQIIRILPLRAILDDRVRRRLRRNGLSEEINNIYADKRQRRSKTVQEMQRLREELAARDAEMERLRREERESLLLLQGEASRLLELEREVLALRQGRERREGKEMRHSNDDSGIGNVSASEQQAVRHHQHRHFDSWDMGAADAFSDDDDDDASLLGVAEDVQMGGVDDDDDDSTTAEGTETPISSNGSNTSLLQKTSLSTGAGDSVKTTTTATASTRPRRSAAAAAAGATLTPPRTSPMKPLSPETEPESALDYCDRGTEPMLMNATTCSAGIQASLEDQEKVALAAELAGLRTDLAQMSETLAAQQRLEAGLRLKLSMAAGADADADADADAEGETDPDLLLQMDIMLQNFADKTAELAELKASLAALVLVGTHRDGHVDDVDAREMVRTLFEAVTAARRELAQLLSDSDDESSDKDEQQQQQRQQNVGIQEILDTLLYRLKSATAQLKQTTTDLHTSRAAEKALQDQLAASSEAITSLTAQVSHYEHEMAPAKEAQVSRLSADVDRLQASVETYTAQVAELESTIAHLHTESAGAHARYDCELGAVRAALADKAKQLTACEEELVAARRGAEDVARALAESRQARSAEVAALGVAHQEERALEREEMARVRQEGEERVAVLRGEKEELLVRLEGERSSARDAVQCLRVQLLGAIKMSEVYLGGVSSLSSSSVAVAQNQQQQQGVEKREEEDGGLAQAKSLA